MTIIRDDEFRKVVALHGGIQVWDTHADTCVAASLGPHERRALADALLGRKPGDEYVDWKAMHAEAVRGRDRVCEVAAARAGRIARLIAARDEANARADAAEAKVRELERERENWRITAINRAAPAATRADIEKAVRVVLCGNPDALSVRALAVTDAVLALVSGTDPAVYVVRESDLPEVQQDEDGFWRDKDGVYLVGRAHTAESARANVLIQLRRAAEFEAVARAIEAEQAVDPIEEQTDSLADILCGDELVTDQMRGVLERVVRAGMLLPEQEADR